MPISFLAAFLGGVVSLFSPCSAMILPSFFASSFHQRKRLIQATVIFSLGLLLVMLPLSLGFLALFNLFNAYRRLITLIIGTILLIEGTLQLTGRSLFISISKPDFEKPQASNLSTAFSFGIISGIGVSSCVGPILGAIITLAANTANITSALVLILFYTLGLIAPLFFISLLWQKNQAKATAILKGKVIKIGSFQLHSINLAAAILFFFLSYIFIKYQGSLGLAPFFIKTGILNTFFDLQDKLFNL